MFNRKINKARIAARIKKIFNIRSGDIPVADIAVISLSLISRPMTSRIPRRKDRGRINPRR